MITPVKAGGWDPEDEFTSAEANGIQERLLKVIDGLDGGTYELQDDLIFDGPGSVVIANDLTLQGGATATLGGTIDLTGQLDVESGADINVRASGEINVKTGGRLDLESGAIASVDAGAEAHVSGDLDIESTGDVTLKAGADLNVESTGEIFIASGGLLNVAGDVNLQSGGDLSVQTGAAIAVASGAEIRALAGSTVEMADANRLTIDAAPFDGYLCMTPITTPSGWSFNITAGAGGTMGWDMAGASGEPITFALPFRPGDTLLTVTMRLEGDGAGGGSHALKPADMPLIEVLRKDVTTGQWAVAGSQVDSSANGPAYDTAHDVTISFGPGHSYVANAVYYVRITAEGGANADAGATRVYSIRFSGLARSYRGSVEAHA